MNLAIAPTAAARYLPRLDSRLRDLLLVVTGSLMVAALAQVAIPLLPFTPVPITGQTFGVLLVGAALGSKRGAASLGLYTLEGALGLPFFAAGASGLNGPTVGYLLGFVAAAFVVGWLAERGMDRRIRTSLLPFLAGTALIYLLGAAWLAGYLHLTPQEAFAKGVLPFLLGDALKMIAAGLALPAAWKLVDRK
jgi:biotin transport system substrate-specific component